MEIAAFLKSYDGPAVSVMEVCGTHTAQIVRAGIPSMLSDRIRLVSGPGCPVCVTVTAYIDRLIELAQTPETTVLTFGDLMRVPGSMGSLADAKAKGASADYVYAPMEVIRRALEEPGRQFVFAAVGFETTAPVYAMLLARLEEEGIKNVRLLTSLKTMPQAIRRVAGGNKTKIDAFLAPGHVCAVTGTGEYEALAGELGLPFVVSGFSGEELLCAIYAAVRLYGRGEMRNLYPAVVRPEGNPAALAAIEKCFEPGDAAWRGMGVIPASGLYLRGDYEKYDAGSRALTQDQAPEGCRCGEVLTGAAAPSDCPMYGGHCTPEHPYGACMVSVEGSCFSAYTGGR